MNPTTRKISLAGALIALAVSSNYLLASIPNVELMTAFVFLGGLMLGWKYGLAIAMIAEGLFSAFNPFGPAPLPVLAFQIAGMALPGLLGGLIGPYFFRSDYRGIKQVALLSATGGVFALQFDLLTTFGTALAMGFSWNAYLGLLSIGIMFYLTHFVANGLIFAILLPTLIRVLRERMQFDLLPDQSKLIEPTPTCDG